MISEILAAMLLAQMASGNVQEIVIPKNFAVPVRIDQELKVAALESDAVIELRVSHDLRWRGCLVFREGAPATAIVSEVRRPGPLGRPSLIVVDVKTVMAADSTLIPLSGSIRAEGEDLTMESIGAAAGVCCLAVFIPGGRKSIGKGVGTLALTATEARVQCVDE